jgi:His-Xaa-Ser system protein HxsD
VTESKIQLSNATVEFDVGLTSADAIQRAAYHMSDTLSLELAGRGDSWHCVIRPIAATALDRDDIEAFRAQVLDYTLRERIRQETEPVRNAVLALAFSQLDLDADVDSA